jgi:hypothetical protein
MPAVFEEVAAHDAATIKIARASLPVAIETVLPIAFIVQMLVLSVRLHIALIVQMLALSVRLHIPLLLVRPDVPLVVNTTRGTSTRAREAAWSTRSAPKARGRSAETSRGSLCGKTRTARTTTIRTTTARSPASSSVGTVSRGRERERDCSCER